MRWCEDGFAGIVTRIPAPAPVAEAEPRVEPEPGGEDEAVPDDRP